MPYRYRAPILAALEGHGLRPTPDTDPVQAYDLLKAIYTFEIRELKARRREAEAVLGPQPLEAYRRQLQQLKERYPVLAIPPYHWVHRGGEGGEGGSERGGERAASGPPRGGNGGA